jgi:thymidylate kinase
MGKPKQMRRVGTPSTIFTSNPMDVAALRRRRKLKKKDKLKISTDEEGYPLLIDQHRLHSEHLLYSLKRESMIICLLPLIQ